MSKSADEDGVDSSFGSPDLSAPPLQTRGRTRRGQGADIPLGPNPGGLSTAGRAAAKNTRLMALSYAMPVVPTVLIMASVNVVQGIYAKYYGLSLTAISGALLLAGLFDALTDPAVGYLSDKQRIRTGTRRFFIVVGALSFPVCAFFFFSPIVTPTAGYFLFWYLAFYLAHTVFTIPHLAWGGEAAPNASDRNTIFSFRSFAYYVGFILFALVPILPFTPTSDVTPETLRITVVVSFILVFPALFVFLRNVPDGHRSERPPKLENPFNAFYALRKNSQFVLFVLGYALYGLSAGVGWSLIFVVLDGYLGIGGAYAYLYLFHLFVCCTSVVVGLRVIEKLDKKQSFLLAIGLSAIAYLTWPFALMNGPYSLYLAGAFMFLMGPSSALGGVVASSLLADIVDYERLKSKVDRSAISFGVMNLGTKTMATFGAAAAFWIAGRFHYNPSAETQTDQVYWGLTLAMSVLPALLCLGAAALISPIVMTSRRHAIIRKRLDQREVRASRDAGLRKEIQQGQMVDEC